MKSMYTYAIAVITGIVLMSACKDQVDQAITTQSTSVDSEDTEIETAKINLAKALVQALQEREVRDFVKNKALEQYDGDYDILYALVKNDRLSSGITFEQSLAKYAPLSEVTTWSELAPLTTIFIPNIPGFSPETWNVTNQIPDVSVLNNPSLHGEKPDLITFGKSLNQYKLTLDKIPTSPVVVIKDNERIIAKSKNSARARFYSSLIERKSTKVIAETNTHSFYFIGDYDAKKGSIKKSVKADNQPRSMNLVNNRPALDELVQYRYYKSGRPNEYGTDRDWVYYKIWPYFNEIELVNPYINGGVDYDWSKGALKGTFYTEKVTAFKFTNSSALASAANDWTEGNLEFHILHTFIYRNGGAQTDLKVFFCSVNQLKDANGNLLTYDPDVELIPWDMYRYGDEWKFSILEHDPSGSTTKTITTKSNFGGNFEFSAEVSLFDLIKFGPKFGASASFEKTETSTVTISQGDTQFGDARFLFDYPVFSTFGNYQDRFSVGTGSVELSIEPVRKQPDTRPNPYVD